MSPRNVFMTPAYTVIEPRVFVSLTYSVVQK